MQTVHGPTGGRRRLRVALRRARDTAGLTQEQVAAAMDWSLSKLIRIEAGTVSISTNDVKALLQLYRIAHPTQVSEFVELARVARRRTWWSRYKDEIPASYGIYIGLEAEAAELCSYHSVGMPGLLHTAAYARAMVEAVAPMHVGLDEVEQRVEIRLRRQREIFDRAERLRLNCVIDEAALRRRIGGTAVLREQLLHLVTLSDDADIVIRVLPFAAGDHTLLGHFVILRFADPDDTDVVYVEGTGVEEIIDQPAGVTPYLETFRRLRDVSLTKAESLALITKIAGELS